MPVGCAMNEAAKGGMTAACENSLRMRSRRLVDQMDYESLGIRG